MKKNILGALLALSATLWGAEAKETKILPIFAEGYCATPTVALMGGIINFDDSSEQDGAYGIELGFACPVFQIQDLEINQVLSFVHSDENGLETNSLEMNPRIMFALNDKTKFGFGPGLGVVFAKANGQNETLFGVNAGASLQYDITKDVFVGFESRYQWTQDAEFVSGVHTDMNNFRNMLKLGTHF